MGRLLIASNRLPVTVREESGKFTLTPSAGGLATALRGPHEQSEGLWFGWPGDLSGANAAERKDVEARLRAMRTVPLAITAREISQYYDGFSNGALWPLFHYLVDKVRLDSERDWHVYQQINRRFAEAIAREHRTGDVIWIHDYQLALVPGYLRRLLPDAVIGFFLHVPFPAAEVFRILPWREAVLRGILGADLVGFHTAGYRYNFAHAAALVLGLDLGTDTLVLDDRAIHIGVFPIGIDVAAFEHAAGRADVADEVARLRAETGGRRILLGIDRLDYTKGIPRRLLALDRLLTSDPTAREQLHFLQVAVPTREKVDAYSELRRNVNELVGRINAQHGTPARAPIQMLYRSIPESLLVALYRAADVMLVTPLRDGMNLVAKEYVASRTDDRGVLVLSELAGAVDELPEALTVNPFDIGGLASTISRAIRMPPEEQALRMSAMRARVRTGNVHAWASRFLAELREPTSGKWQARPLDVPDPALHAKVLAAAKAPARLILLDYDGTLVPLAPLPDLAAPDAELKRLLSALAETPHTEVHILTGRGRTSIERWLGDLPVVLHAEHGFWSRWNALWVANRVAPDGWKERVEPLLLGFAERTPGSFVEEKTASLALHYRGSDPTLVAERLRELRPRLDRAIEGQPLETLDGSKILEVRITGANKGLVVQKLVAEVHPDTAVLCAGDDRTDEDMFANLPERAISIRVGQGRSHAEHRVDSSSALRDVLGLLLDAGTP